MGTRQRRAAFLEKVNFGSNFFLRIFRQGMPPSLEGIRVLDLSCHISNITYME
jgi:hypothetical protein